MGTILLCRHGETTWNRDRRVQGWAPTELTGRGRAQADALAGFLDAEYAVDRVVASDLERAAETARGVSRATGAEATFDARWRERDFGRMQGLTYDELFGAYPEYTLSEIGYAAAEAVPESGESLLDMWERVREGFTGLRDDLGEGETVAVVAHGGPLYAVTGDIKGLDVVAAVLDQDQGNCAVNEIRVGHDDGGVASDGSATVELVRENVTSFLSEATTQENY
ncbi:histidine phosphatase family protein [Halobaculum sp. CBA1158]|uniref:histidine phosphatase family protein n=1 Tax=Halobaculum sp. CBA1158 TaxID=2904243 RepID=UPI001F41E434|nr:histidine phosphatase family protein [Halobaculum sp. CBA1158]UIO99862.1 histidine phosphatase family protein [Halobaculum sp. CBA1158]